MRELSRQSVSLKADEVYRRLLDVHGRQGWWPITRYGETMPSYHPGEWPKGVESEQTEIVIGAVLTQNTAWKNVEKALTKLHEAKAMNLASLARMDVEELGQIIRSSGFFRQKARRLQSTARLAIESGGWARLFSLHGPLIRAKLLEWPGLGPETVDSILLYAGNKPTFVVDAYTQRIMGRLGVLPSPTPYEEVQSLLASSVPKDPFTYGEYHALLVAHGKRFCAKSRPRCLDCCLEEVCAKRL